MFALVKIDGINQLFWHLFDLLHYKCKAVLQSVYWLYCTEQLPATVWRLSGLSFVNLSQTSFELADWSIRWLKMVMEKMMNYHVLTLSRRYDGAGVKTSTRIEYWQTNGIDYWLLNIVSLFTHRVKRKTIWAGSNLGT